MSGLLSAALDSGLEVMNLDEDAAFAARPLHERDMGRQIEGMRRLSQAFVEAPETILQELVNAAVEFCGADSAGISMVQDVPTEDNTYRWVAAAGQYKDFLNATLPRSPSACGICLERGKPQLFRVGQPFFDVLGVVAAEATDGILMQWEVGTARGTIWIVAHGRTEAFDIEDLKMMQLLADFAAMAVRQQEQQKLLMKQAQATAAANMANQLAHEINNPLQSLTNLVYLAKAADEGGNARELAGSVAEQVERLSRLVNELLALPKQ